MESLRLFGCFFIGIAIILFLFGKATYVFNPVLAKVESVERVTGFVGGGGALPKGPILSSDRSPTQTWLLMEYRYEVDGSQYLSSSIGLYMPFNLGVDDFFVGDNIIVYVAPYSSKLVVLKRGADLRIIVPLLLLGSCFLILQSWLQQMLVIRI